MKSAVENLSPTRVKLTVEVPFSELQSSVDAAYKKIGQQVQLPGFRRGKVPPALIDRRFGRAVVLDEAVNDALPNLYVQALEENDVEALGQPQVDVTKFEDGADLTFTAEVDAKPDITLPDYAGTQIEVDTAEVTDADVDEQLHSLAQRFGSLTDVERAAANDDFVTIDLSASQDHGPIEDAHAEGLSYQVGSGQGLDGLDDALVGMSAGESKTFPTTLVAGGHAGEQADVTVTVTAVREQKLPDLDDDFAQMASEFDTIGELTDALRSQIERQKRLDQATQARDAVLEKLIELTEVPVPEGVVTEELTTRRESINAQLEQVGMTLDQYLAGEGQSAEEFDADLDKRARDALRSQFILDKIADEQKLSVSQDELTQHLIARAQQSQMSPDEYAQQVVQNNYVPVLVREVVRGKALAQALEAFNVVDGQGVTIDFARLRPDGSVADEGEDQPTDEGTDGPTDEAQAEPTDGAGEQAGDETPEQSDETAEQPADAADQPTDGEAPAAADGDEVEARA